MTVLFAATLFLSSALLFSVQPMVGKMLLPGLGGTPAVWNTCMVFFQAALLAGYLYAHLGSRWLGVRRQIVVHGLLLLTPLLVLPMDISMSGPAAGDDSPILWLLSRLLVVVAAPFVVVSSSAPLLQRWFARSGHRQAADPYWLYAVSNVGSLAALLGYPLVIEPGLTLAEQSRWWEVGYAGLVLLTWGCGVVIWWGSRARGALDGEGLLATGGDVPNSSPGPPLAGGVAESASLASGVTWRRRLYWVLLAFVPSSLMLGVTTYVTTEIAAAPLLWVVPLALYLLTFILAFASRQPVSLRTLSLLLPAALPVWMLTPVQFGGLTWILLPGHLLVFFMAALLCHSRLAADRPDVRHLTEFYLWVSIGGVLGGAFNALLAPLAFSRVIEYPLVFVLACLLKPRLREGADTPRRRRSDVLLPAALAAGACAVVLIARQIQGLDSPLAKLLVFFVPAVACFLFRERPVRFGLGVAAFLFATGLYAEFSSGQTLTTARNFFGVKRVQVDAGAGYHSLIHSGTNHGTQSTDPARRGEPLAYYCRSGPVGDVFAALEANEPTGRVAVIGLGVGAMAAYARPGQQFTFYEIDPAVTRLAETRDYFTFLADCAGDYDIVMGDGRLRIAEAANGAYNLIVLDAFSSDAVPTHLISREAVALYRSKLRPNGMLAFHVSSRHLDLVPVLGNVAADAGMACLTRSDSEVTAEERAAGKLASRYVVMAEGESGMGVLLADRRWKRVPRGAGAVWTDQYCNVLSVLRW